MHEPPPPAYGQQQMKYTPPLGHPPAYDTHTPSPRHQDNPSFEMDARGHFESGFAGHDNGGITDSGGWGLSGGDFGGGGFGGHAGGGGGGDGGGGGGE